jgi:flagellar hook-length control protein FliK
VISDWHSLCVHIRVEVWPKLYEVTEHVGVWGFMNTIGSMNSLPADTHVTPKAAKSGSARGDVDSDRMQGGFDALIAGLFQSAPPPAQDQPKRDDTATPDASVSVTDDTNRAIPTQVDQQPQATQELALVPTSDATPISDQSSGTPTLISATLQNGAAQASAGQVAAADTLADASAANAAALPTVQVESAGQDTAQSVLAQLTALSDLTATPSDATAPTNSAPAAPAPTAKTHAPAQTQTTTSDTASDTSQPQAAPQSPNQVAQAPASPASSTSPKAKTLEANGVAKTGEPVSLTPDAQIDAGHAFTETATATPADQTARAPQLTPHTIPMLAATMMRRLESGSKQFSMRLDPPELGQVEVKLTVDADKKVRAVVSADRPEALADLVRSARELTRALLDAGLDLEDNGLTFTLNDPAGDQSKNSQSQSQQRADTKNSGLHVIADNVADQTQDAAPKANTHTPNDPFQSWQRARIAISA